MKQGMASAVPIGEAPFRLEENHKNLRVYMYVLYLILVNSHLPFCLNNLPPVLKRARRRWKKIEGGGR